MANINGQSLKFGLSLIMDHIGKLNGISNGGPNGGLIIPGGMADLYLSKLDTINHKWLWREPLCHSGFSRAIPVTTRSGRFIMYHHVITALEQRLCHRQAVGSESLPRTNPLLPARR